MNSTSFGEVGGRVGRVDGGSLLVGWPGAPGCTITGAAGSACWAQTGNENEAGRMIAARNELRSATTLIADPGLGVSLRPRRFMNLNLNFETILALSQSADSIPHRHLKLFQLSVRHFICPGADGFVFEANDIHAAGHAAAQALAGLRE